MTNDDRNHHNELILNALADQVLRPPVSLGDRQLDQDFLATCTSLGFGKVCVQDKEHSIPAHILLSVFAAGQAYEEALNAPAEISAEHVYDDEAYS